MYGRKLSLRREKKLPAPGRQVPTFNQPLEEHPRLGEERVESYMRGHAPCKDCQIERESGRLFSL
jgi:hypothetical protein